MLPAARMFDKDGHMSELLIERFVGIDVSKTSLDLFADPPAAALPRHVAYADGALKVLCDGLAAVAPTLVVMAQTVEVEL